MLCGNVLSLDLATNLAALTSAVGRRDSFIRVTSSR